MGSTPRLKDGGSLGIRSTLDLYLYNTTDLQRRVEIVKDIKPPYVSTFTRIYLHILTQLTSELE